MQLLSLDSTQERGRTMKLEPWTWNRANFVHQQLPTDSYNGQFSSCMVKNCWICIVGFME